MAVVSGLCQVYCISRRSHRGTYFFVASQWQLTELLGLSCRPSRPHRPLPEDATGAPNLVRGRLTHLLHRHREAPMNLCLGNEELAPGRISLPIAALLVAVQQTPLPSSSGPGSPKPQCYLPWHLLAPKPNSPMCRPEGLELPLYVNPPSPPASFSSPPPLHPILFFLLVLYSCSFSLLQRIRRRESTLYTPTIHSCSLYSHLASDRS